MKSQLIRNISVALLSAAYMFGQEPQRITVQIPFGFHVGDSMLPPGQYTVATEVQNGVVRLRSADFQSSVMALTNGIEPRTRSNEAKLVFNRYGNEYFLSQIWTSSTDPGRALLKTKRETETAANRSRGSESVMARK